MLVLNTIAVRVLAAERGISISKLLREAKLSSAFFWQAEKRHGKVALDTVGKLAAVLNVDPGVIQKEVKAN